MKKHLRQTTNVLYAMLIASSANATTDFQKQSIDTFPSGSSSSSSSSASLNLIQQQDFKLPQVYLNPNEIKKEMKEALSRAQAHIVISSPFVSNNSLEKNGTSEILKKKNKTGVKVLALLGQELTHDKPHETKGIELLQTAGAKVRHISKLHAKYVLVDDKILLLGSFNFLSGSLESKNMYYLLNAVIRIDNPSDAILNHCYYIADEYAKPVPLTRIADNFSVMSSTADIVSMQKYMMHSATSTLDICSAYLSETMLEASGYLDILKQKVKSGVNVTIYVDTRSTKADKKREEFNQICETLLRAGINLIKKDGIHCKWIIQDDRDLYLGSDNMLASGAGEGSWRELGVHMTNAIDQIGEIRTQMSLVKTIEDASVQAFSQAVAKMQSDDNGWMTINRPVSFSKSTSISDLKTNVADTNITSHMADPAPVKASVAVQPIPKRIEVNIGSLPVEPLHQIEKKPKALAALDDDSSSESEDGGLSVGSSSEEEEVVHQSSSHSNKRKHIQSDEESVSEESVSESESEDDFLQKLEAMKKDYLKSKQKKKAHDVARSSKAETSSKKNKYAEPEKKHAKKDKKKGERIEFTDSDEESTQVERKRLKKGSKS